MHYYLKQYAHFVPLSRLILATKIKIHIQICYMLDSAQRVTLFQILHSLTVPRKKKHPAASVPHTQSHSRSNLPSLFPAIDFHVLIIRPDRPEFFCGFMKCVKN